MRKLIILTLLLPLNLALAERLRVPDYITCDRNLLTSWKGTITNYQRLAGHTQFTVNTEDGTVEVLSLVFEQQSELMAQYRVNGKPFVVSDWKHIETINQQLISGTRATVWLCQDYAVAPIVNWQVKN